MMDFIAGYPTALSYSALDNARYIDNAPEVLPYFVSLTNLNRRQTHSDMVRKLYYD